MVFKCKEQIKPEELAAKLAKDLGLEARGTVLFFGNHYFSAIRKFDKNGIRLLFSVPNDKKEFRIIGQKAKRLPYLKLYLTFKS